VFRADASLAKKSPATKGDLVADPIPVGSDVSSGTYRCTNCGYELGVQSVQSLPPCPKCDGPYAWATVSGGDSAEDPYPEQS
jgi:lipopolysaccharide biosynthesis regulator YciM